MKRSASGQQPAGPPRRSRRRRLDSGQDAGNDESNTNIASLSSPLGPEETWQELEQAARGRLSNYRPLPAERPNDSQLQPTLSAFLDWLPQEGKESLAKDINGAGSDDVLWGIYQNLVTALLEPMKSRSHRNSIVSSPHSHRQSNSDTVAAMLVEPQSREETFRSNCLLRDGNCCVITGSMEVGAWAKLGRPSNAAPPGLADAWEVLFRCFPAVRRMGLRVESINELSNAITLQSMFHTMFGEFNISFEATGVANQYRVKTYRNCPNDLIRDIPANSLVNLTKARGAEHLPLPDPALLDCHHRLAEILNASGIGEYIEKKLQDWEETKDHTGPGHLAPNGTTDLANVLEAAFWESVAG